MFRFYNPEILNILFLLPIIIIWFYFYIISKKKKIRSFAPNELHDLILKNKSYNKEIFRFVIFLIAFSLIILTAARPQLGSKLEEVKILGSDVFLLLDVSQSMLAQDLKPDRLSQAKNEIGMFIKRLQGDRIGMIVFAGDAFVQIPLTTDYSAAGLFLEAVDENSVPTQGTAVASSILLAVKSFDYSKNSKKVIIIISDGEDHEGDLENVINEVKSKGIIIYTIGMGSQTGSPIPNLDQAGNVTGFKKDKEGNTVVTKLDEKTLKEIAEKCDGKYFLATGNQNELDLIYKDLMSFDKSELGNKKITEYEEKFHMFLIPGIILLIWELFIFDRKSKFLAKILEKIKNKN